MGSGYNRNNAKLILAKILRVHGQAAVDQLISEMDLETNFGFKPGGNYCLITILKVEYLPGKTIVILFLELLQESRLH